MMMNVNPLIVLATGGSGGHVFPAEALANELSALGYRLLLITDNRGSSFAGPMKAVETCRVPAGGLADKSLMRRVASLFELAFGTVKAMLVMARKRPALVVGFGGYASVPAMLAARILGTPSMVHEQNAVLGRANRLFAKTARRIAVCYPHVKGINEADRKKTVITGMPVRKEIIAAQGHPYPDLDEHSPVHILVTGGSQGARILSQVVPAAMAKMDAGIKSRLRITQQCRPEDLAAADMVYKKHGIDARLTTFIDDVPEQLCQAHLVISRSGASTVAEILCVGRPAIMVPYRFAVDNHQDLNAHSVDEAGAGWMMPEQDLTVDVLAARVQQLIELPAILQKAARAAKKTGVADAAHRLAAVVAELAPVASVTAVKGGR